MKLTARQIEDFNREGWLFPPELFAREETDLLAQEAVRVYDADRPEVWREKGGAPRTAFAAHLYNEAFGLLGAHPRKIVYLTLNAVCNYMRTPTRPDYIAHRDFTAIETVDDDALPRLARSHRQAAE